MNEGEPPSATPQLSIRLSHEHIHFPRTSAMAPEATPIGAAKSGRRDQQRSHNPHGAAGRRQQTLMSTATRAWWIFDGALTGYKLFRRLRGFTGFFGKRKGRR